MGGDELKLLSNSCELGETILSLTWDLWRMTKFLFDTLSIPRVNLYRLPGVSGNNIREYWPSIIEFSPAWRRSKNFGRMSETQKEDSSVTRAQAIKLKPRSSGGSPCESPNSKQSPRNSPRNSPLLFRKLLMNRSIVLQRRFTLAHTPRYCASFALWADILHTAWSPYSFDFKYVVPFFWSASHYCSASAYHPTLSIKMTLADTRLCGVA